MVHSSPAISEGRVFVSGCDEFLHLVDLETGMEVGKVTIGAPTAASPVVTDKRAFVGTYASKMEGIDWKKETLIWEYAPLRSEFRYSAALHEQWLIFGGRDKRVHALNRETGEVKWTFLTRRAVDSSPVIVGNRVFVGSGDGNLYELDLKSGKERWRYTLGLPITSSPAVASGCLVIGGGDGRVYCFGEK